MNGWANGQVNEAGDRSEKYRSFDSTHIHRLFGSSPR